MNMPPLPPQAYTREMLANAYEWLKSQPGSIRELATSADALVSLYLQSRRRGRQTTIQQRIEAASGLVSSQSFKSDLKDLAVGLQQFDDAKPEPTGSFNKIEPVVLQPQMEPPAQQQQQQPTVIVNTYSVSPQTVNTHSNPHLQHQTAHSSQPQMPHQSNHSGHQQQTSAIPPGNNHNQQQTTHHQQPSHSMHQYPMMDQQPIPQHQPSRPQPQQDYKLDSKSLEQIKKIQSGLNLSSQDEALRVMIAIGYERLKDLLPK